MRLITTWTKRRKSDFTGDDSLHYSFTALLATMLMRGTQKHVSTMYPQRAPGVARGAPLAAFFFGDTRFRRRKLRIACFALSGKSALIPLRLLSKSQPLRWVVIL